MLTEFLPSPFEVKQAFPLLEKGREFVEKSKKAAKAILRKKDSRIALIAGPCSIHDYDAALAYAEKLKLLSEKVKERFFLVMRVFLEKPRTTVGWKGLAYDPLLDGSHQIEEGLFLSRKLLLALADKKVPAALEFVDPLFAPYVEDLVTWGFVGARTSASQPHRQMASGLSSPIGFKNQVDGNIDVALDSILSANAKHSHMGIDQEGRIAKISTNGNPFCHLVLRGSEQGTNFDPLSVEDALKKMKKQGIDARLLIDCSHGNARKKAEKQILSFHSVIEQIAKGNDEIMGLMLESFLETGRQDLKSPADLLYGTSITDSCLGWQETEDLILQSLYSLPKADASTLQEVSHLSLERPLCKSKSSSL